MKTLMLSTLAIAFALPATAATPTLPAPVCTKIEECPADTVLVSTKQRVLLYKSQDGRVLRYRVGVGRDGFTWSGTTRIAKMREWPDWTPPPEMVQRQPWLPRHMEGGLENPLGARALYLFEGDRDTMYRIHGSNAEETIGTAVSSGCFRLANDDVIHLYRQVRVGTVVVVLP